MFAPKTILSKAESKMSPSTLPVQVAASLGYIPVTVSQRCSSCHFSQNEPGTKTTVYRL